MKPGFALCDEGAPATLARVEEDPCDPFRGLIPEYDLILTYGGGPPVVEHYTRLGAAGCHPIYNALDPEAHHPVPADPAFHCDLAVVGNRLPHRGGRAEEFFFCSRQLVSAPP